VTADKLPIEDILTVKHDVVPLDGADVFQQGEIESIGTRIALTEDREISDPVGDLGQDQAVQVFHLLPQLAGVNPPAARKRRSWLRGGVARP